MLIQSLHNFANHYPTVTQPFKWPGLATYQQESKQQIITFLAVFALSLTIGYLGSSVFSNLAVQSGIKNFSQATGKCQLLKIFAQEALLPALWEEAVFRGFLPTAIKSVQKRMGFDENSRSSLAFRVALNVLIFDGLHLNVEGNWETNTLTFFKLLPLSIQLASSVEETKTIYTPITLHFGYNAGNLILARLAG